MYLLGRKKGSGGTTARSSLRDNLSRNAALPHALPFNNGANFKMPPFARSLRQARILILEIFNIFLWLKFSPLPAQSPGSSTWPRTKLNVLKLAQRIWITRLSKAAGHQRYSKALLLSLSTCSCPIPGHNLCVKRRGLCGRFARPEEKRARFCSFPEFP